MSIWKAFKRKPLRQRLEKRFKVYTEAGEILLGDFDNLNWDYSVPYVYGRFKTIGEAETARQEKIEEEIKRREPRKIISE